MKKLGYTVLGGLLVFEVAPALFERLAPRPWVVAFRRAMNPLYLPLAGRAPGWAVIETVGRRSGKPRLTPVGGRLSADAYWLVAIDGRQAQYVRNIESNPVVRVRVHGRWRAGRARLLSDDDPNRRLWRLNPVNSLFLWTYGGLDPLTIRIDLQPSPGLQTDDPAPVRATPDTVMGPQCGPISGD
jgi:deazaflavin-dependent oxidoreductase (nitroreductase family)